MRKQLPALAVACAFGLAACSDNVSPTEQDAAVDAPPTAQLSLRFTVAPPAYLAPGDLTLPVITVAVTDTAGREHPELLGNVALAVEGGSLTGSLTAPLSQGRAMFAGLTAAGPGALTLRFSHPRAGTLEARVVIAQTETYVPVVPREARQGLAYDEALPDVSMRGAMGPLRYLVSRGTLPAGLRLDPATGHLAGTPTGPEFGGQIDVIGYDAQFTAFRFGVHLAVFDRDDSNNDSDEDLTLDGQYLAGHITTRIAMADTDADVSVIITYPTSSFEGPPADGKFPVVVFHQAVPIVGTNPPIYDRYEALLDHWATRGYISISIDATRVYFRTSASSSIINLSFNNLLRVHRYIRSEIDYLHTIDADPAHPLHQHVDFDHLVVAGHSRGGGGTVVALDRSPDVLGFMALQPVNPLGSPGGSGQFNYALPPRPLLLVSAGRDGDVIFPIVDTIYDQTTGPTALLTIRGGKHAFTKRVEPVDGGPAATITAAEQVAITQVYTTAFLDRYVRMNLTRESMLYGPRGLSTSITQAPDNGVLMRARRYIVSQPVIDFSGDAPTMTAMGTAVTSSNTDVFAVANPFANVLRRNMLTGADWNATATFTRSLGVTFSRTGAGFVIPLGAGLDVHDRLALVLSAERESSILRDMDLRVTDAGGHTATVSLASQMGQVGLGDRFSTAIVALSALTEANSALDLTHLTELSFQFPGNTSTGQLWLDEVRFE